MLGRVPAGALENTKEPWPSFTRKLLISRALIGLNVFGM
jgi:hypothetical protein